METFLKNYWSLYNDFLIKFENLVYKGLSIPYLCHFPSFVTRERVLRNELYRPAFTQHIEHEVKDQAEFQQKFNQFMATHTKISKKNSNNKEKVVIHVDKLLRFPPSTFMNSFDPKNTLMLTVSEQRLKAKKSKVTTIQTPTVDGSTARKKYNSGSVGGINQIPTVSLNSYQVNIDKEIVKIENQARVILDDYRHHHVYGSNNFRQWFFDKLRAVINRINMTERFLEEHAVSCFIVSTTHSYINRILAVVGARKGVPTICMQHGIISSELGYIPKIATVDAVYGQFEKDFYEKLGISNNATQIIGHPRFDQLQVPSKLSRSQFYKKMQLDTKRKTLLLIVRGPKDMEKWRTLIQTLSKQHKLNIVVRNYPSKKIHPLTQEFSFVHQATSLQLDELFPHVDLVIAYSSTVALEAMLANKHVFILKDDFEGDTDYFSKLGDFVQSNSKKLTPLIEKYLSDSLYQKEAEKRRVSFLKTAYPDRSLSSMRLKNLINHLSNT